MLVRQAKVLSRSGGGLIPATPHAISRSVRVFFGSKCDLRAGAFYAIAFVDLMELLVRQGDLFIQSFSEQTVHDFPTKIIEGSPIVVGLPEDFLVALEYLFGIPFDRYRSCLPYLLPSYSA